MGTRWSIAKDLKLKRLFGEGLKDKAIAPRVGTTRHGVALRRIILGLRHRRHHKSKLPKAGTLHKAMRKSEGKTPIVFDIARFHIEPFLAAIQDSGNTIVLRPN